MLKRIVNFLRRKLTDKLIDEDLIIRKIESKKIQQLNNQVTAGVGSNFYPEAEVYNLQHDRLKIKIGNNCHIRGELLILPYSKGIEIGENCYIGKNSIVRSYERIKIGDSVLIAHNVTIIDSDSHEIDYIERQNGYIEMIRSGIHHKGKITSLPIKIDDHVWISYNVAILKGVTIGKGAIIGAGAVVTKDVPAFTMVAGNPARVVKELPH